MARMARLTHMARMDFQVDWRFRPEVESSLGMMLENSLLSGCGCDPVASAVVGRLWGGMWIWIALLDDVDLVLLTISSC